MRGGKITERGDWSHKESSYNFSKASDYTTKCTDGTTMILQVHSHLKFCFALFFPGKKDILMCTVKGHSPWRVMDTNGTARDL